MMTEARRRWIEEARLRVTHAALPFGARVWLFGSCARGDASRFSDIDIAVEAKARLSGMARAAIDEAIESSCIPCDVDVVDLADVSDTFRARVMAEAVEWTA
ncbi:nucleotidyltransferase domain-containing protein [Paramagnetospirillum kuznetsovii]|uniref:Nucleotidyltransferase domain-containing protein n=1 Tax=Paramagnetospirillum kuznetsovii TaxID=2053833 RepID=A0A364NV33_9PROT|nr:nucleotidyltransferase domain-containing protein [Paramagnetospirillum kuznetsovii]RAU20922.1 nucleotidyltransferase domain-containing protein [Paramagnetospirillum kuznetsovii]